MPNPFTIVQILVHQCGSCWMSSIAFFHQFHGRFQERTTPVTSTPPIHHRRSARRFTMQLPRVPLCLTN
ncbi:hypothetical protein BDY17DRAFT_292452 [Neohortaea acidophila]|uniref:Uncharacterized protein n=1 Tax=Neohortaea acidophila TaxID=245834 RepID=A0A6A6Q082_9PEZI|nr:uncharacterized protein BDY17DRAFT_292452 [Neohortaea acidophila]KAF2484827.1 hypothetical protein BDY17DRAFT_292452 [Neohortaea acidophila]